MTEGKIDLPINPTVNPAVIDTLCWDCAVVVADLKNISANEWVIIKDRLYFGYLEHIYSFNTISFYNGTVVSVNGVLYVLGRVCDNQFVFISFSEGSRQVALTKPFYSMKFGKNWVLKVFESSMENIHLYVDTLNPLLGPRALGPIPRLGIGSRNSTAAWPGVFNAIKKGRFAGNPIQNSVRELGLLEEFLGRKKPDINHLFSFGPVPEAYTGATFEGLWTAGVVAAMTQDFIPFYGADADHLQVKRDDRSETRLEKVLSAARHYTFFTIDLSAILDYGALYQISATRSLEYLEAKLGDPTSALRKSIVLFHRQKNWFNGRYFRFDEATIGRLVGKYWDAINKLEEVYQVIYKYRGGRPFDFEFTIDEIPPGFNVFDTLTSEVELIFILNEAKRRGLPLTHLAPNFGVEKMFDYRGWDGHLGLERRVSALYRIADSYNILLDCHSGDDLSSDTRKVFGRATQGRLHYKISPCMGDIFARVLKEYEPEKYCLWWDKTLDYAQQCASEGSKLASNLLREYQRGGGREKNPDCFLFKEFKFTLPGRKDENGGLPFREMFYDLSEDLAEAYIKAVEEHITDIAFDLFN